jgi:hypothetical protein
MDPAVATIAPPLPVDKPVQRRRRPWVPRAAAYGCFAIGVVDVGSALTKGALRT